MANNNKNHREVSLIEESMRNGLLFGEAWTKKWGFKVTPWYSMDKVKLSFIDVGKAGKGNSFDICISVKAPYHDDLMKLIVEMLPEEETHVRPQAHFLDIMKYEGANKVPEGQIRYHWRTGSNGEKNVYILNSSTDGTYSGRFCVKGETNVNGKKVVAMIPISYYDLYDMAEAIWETYQIRLLELKKLRAEGIEKAQSYHKANEPMDADYNPESDASPAADKKPEQTTEKPTKAPKQPAQANEKSKPSYREAEGRFIVKKILSKDGDEDLAFEGLRCDDADNVKEENPYRLILTKKAKDGLSDADRNNFDRLTAMLKAEADPSIAVGFKLYVVDDKSMRYTVYLNGFSTAK